MYTYILICSYTEAVQGQAILVPSDTYIHTYIRTYMFTYILICSYTQAVQGQAILVPSEPNLLFELRSCRLADTEVRVCMYIYVVCMCICVCVYKCVQDPN